MRYANKRQAFRSGNGRFRKPKMQDFGIGGVCEKCHHFLIHTYDGDPQDPHPHPQKFRYRCFTCEPKTEAELAREAEIEAAKPKKTTLEDLFRIQGMIE